MNYLASLLTAILAISGLLFQPKKNPDQPISWFNLNRYGKLLFLFLIITSIVNIGVIYKNDQASIILENNRQGLLSDVDELNESQEKLRLENKKLLARLRSLKEDNANLLTSVTNLTKIAQKIDNQSEVIQKQTQKYQLDVKIIGLKALSQCDESSKTEFYYTIIVEDDTLISVPVTNTIDISKGKTKVFDNNSFSRTIFNNTQQFTVSGFIKERDGKTKVRRKWKYTLVGDLDHRFQAGSDWRSDKISLLDSSCKAELLLEHQIKKI